MNGAAIGKYILDKLPDLLVLLPGSSILGVLIVWETQLRLLLEGTITNLWQFRILALLLMLCVSLLTYLYLNRSKLVEHCGAYFKRNRKTYHWAVYCGDPKCVLPTFVNDSNLYECKCGWKSSFSVNEIETIVSTLPKP